MLTIQKSRYLFVLIATIMVFTLGLLMGGVINREKDSVLEQATVNQNLDDLSLNLQFTYLNSLDINSTKGCKVMQTALEHSWVNLDNAYQNMIQYKDSRDAEQGTIKLLERNDLLNNIRYWFLLKKAKSFCKLDDSVSVLFFFKDEDCFDCDTMSSVLEYYKDAFGDRFLLFHINANIEDPMVQMLSDQYGVTEYPAIVLGERKFSGRVPKDELKGLICANFKTEQPECKS